MIPRINIRINLLLIYVIDAHTGAILAHYLGLEAEFSMAHRPHKVCFALACRLLLFGQGMRRELHSFGVDDLRRGEVLKDVVLDFEQVDGQLFVERLCELLGEVDEQVEHVVVLVGQEDPLLEVSLAALEALGGAVVVFRDLEQLLEEHDHKFDHLLVLLAALLLLQDLIDVHDQGLDHLGRQEVLLVRVQLPEQVNLDPALALLVGQLCQLTEKHEA